MYVTFVAFYLLWVRPGMALPASAPRRFTAGLLAGLALAFDYSGVVPMLALFGYLMISRLSTATWWRSGVEAALFVLGTFPSVGFLLFSQWVMFGNPILPAQHWMPNVNYTENGWRGFDWPAADLFARNLFDPAYGMFVFGPILLLGLIPGRWYPADSLILPRRERLFVAIFTLLFLMFCASNQYARMQWNTGFRMLLPVVPFLYLAACDHLARLPAKWLAVVSVPCLLQCWVLSMYREDVIESWRSFLSQGVQYPWLTVLRQTSPQETGLMANPVLPLALLALCGCAILAIWCAGIALERRAERRLTA
jgi:hypothetical protein